MIAGRNSEDYSPITWVGRFPVYLTTVLVAVHVVCLVVVALLMSMGQAGVIDLFRFSSERVLDGFMLWQFITYAFVNEPGGALWFVIEMYLLFTFGREVEKFLGRQAFAMLYLALILVAPLFLMAVSLFGEPQVLTDGGAVNFAVFIAFVVIYPSAQFFFGLEARWIAAVLLAIYSLQYVAYRAWMPMSVLWLDCLCAYGMMRLRGVGGFGTSFETWELPPEKPKRRRLKKVEREAEIDPYESIDPLLEKISKDGIASLTKRERERLEKAREALIQREKD
ncbi:MAG: rhomboid family intramembrane serine protease [Chthoniobacterales bacterium]